MSKRFLILGAGRQGGACAAFLLERFDDTFVDFLDTDPERLASAAALQRDAGRVAGHRLSAHPPSDQLLRLMSEADCIISCVPYFLNEQLTQAAIDVGKPFCDLGGNVGTVRAQIALGEAARRAGVAVVPDCGLAPGLLSILGEYWADSWDYRSVRLYCGGLPQNPRGRLQYALTFSVYGLLNEYFDDCQVARRGRVETIAGMSELETLSDLALPGQFEAFATSGGASLGPEMYAPRGVDYQYKTVRYPGHAHIIQALREMGFFDPEPREFRLDGQTVSTSPLEVCGRIMEQNLRSDGHDLIVAQAIVTGTKDGKARTGRIDLVDYAVDRFTAMERTTGFPTAIVAAALAGLYETRIAPGAYVPFQVMDPQMVIAELARGGVTGISVREQ